MRQKARHLELLYALRHQPVGIDNDDIFRPPSYRLSYLKAVEFGEHRLMFRPRDSFDQTVLSPRLEVDPKPDYVRWIHDVFANCVATAFGQRS